MSKQNQKKSAATTPRASLSKRDYADHQSISQRTLDYWREAGLPCLAISTRKILFPVAECDQWVRDRFLKASVKK